MSACFCLIKSNACSDPWDLWPSFQISRVMRVHLCVFYGTFCWGAGYQLPLSCLGCSFIICLTLMARENGFLVRRAVDGLARSTWGISIDYLQAWWNESTVNTVYHVSPGVEAGERGNVCVRIEIPTLCQTCCFVELSLGIKLLEYERRPWALLFGQLEGLNVTFVQESMTQTTWQLVDKTRLLKCSSVLICKCSLSSDPQVVQVINQKQAQKLYFY